MKSKPIKNLEPTPTVSLVKQEKIYSGPLPMPEDLAKYDAVVPGAAERILKMAEEEANHRRKRDNRMDWSVIITTFVSIVLAFCSVILLSYLAYQAILNDQPSVAITITGTTIAAVAGVFIFKSKGKEE